MNREQWLERAVSEFRMGLFKRHGFVVPKVRVSVGFPGTGNKHTAIGEHWHPNSATDNQSQIFISPTLFDATRVLDVLAHELIHAIVPEAGHKKPFRDIAVSIGLTGKMTKTVASPELKIELEYMAEKVLGPYPHAALNLSERKKQTTRLNKVSCSDCGYTCRVTSKWLDDAGAPLCPCNGEQMQVEASE